MDTVQRHVTHLLALARDFDMRHAAARMPEVRDLELAQFLTPQRVIEQRRQNGAVALGLHRFLRPRRGQLAGLVIAEGWRGPFAAVSLRSLDAFDRVLGDGISLAQIFEQR